MSRKKKIGRVKLWLNNIVLLGCVVVFIFSMWKLIGYVTEYQRGEQSYEEVSQHVTVLQPVEDEKGELVEKPPIVNWTELESLNSDLVAWIHLEDTAIQYPVVKGEDNGYYLTHTFQKEKNNCGSIFMNADNEVDFTSENTVLYGHNLKTGKMFGTLKYYEDQEYWEEHPDIWIVTKDRVLKYRIYSVYETDDTSEVYTLEFDNEEAKQQYIDTSKEKSLYDTGVNAKVKHRLLTLSTCISDTEEGRFIVQARLVSDEEINNE